MTRSPRTTSKARRRVLAATATLGVVAVLGGVPAAHADGGGDATSADAALASGDAGSATTTEAGTPSEGDQSGDQSGDQQGDQQGDQPGDEPSATTGGGSDDAAGDGAADGAADGAGGDGKNAAGPDAGSADGAGDGTGGDDAAAPAEGPSSGPTPTTEAVTREVRSLAQAIIPDFGNGKLPITEYRLGVTRADGAFVPDGSSTLGSTLTYQVGGEDDGVDDGEGLPFPTSGTCTTTEAGADGASYCADTVPVLNGTTITVTQTAANPGYVAGSPVTHQPTCEPGGDLSDVELTCSASATVADTGTPPSAQDDASRTSQGDSVDIDVLANDDNGNGAPVTGTTISSAPAHGSATFAGGSGGGGAAAITGGPVVRYVPQRGFSGTDTFRYTFSTANGSATGTVSVQVVGTPAAPRPGGSSASAPRVAPAAAVESTPTGALPDTGGVDVRLLGLGSGLLGAGAVVVVASRRRRTAQD